MPNGVGELLGGEAAGMGAVEDVGVVVRFIVNGWCLSLIDIGGGDERDGAQDAGEYQAGPVPPAPIELWLGSQGPRMLALTGRDSDGWVCPLNIYVSPDDVPQRQRSIDDAARTAGRDPADVRRIYNACARRACTSSAAMTAKLTILNASPVANAGA